MSWLISSMTTELLQRMAQEHQVLVAAEARRAPIEHPCGCCHRLAPRVETCATGEVALYVCDACGHRTFVVGTRVDPR